MTYEICIDIYGKEAHVVQASSVVQVVWLRCQTLIRALCRLNCKLGIPRKHVESELASCTLLSSSSLSSISASQEETSTRTMRSKTKLQLETYLRLKHSFQTSSFKLGSVASNNKKAGRAMLSISIQFCLGTVDRTLRCFMHFSYVPEVRFRMIGTLHGFNEGSEAMV